MYLDTKLLQQPVAALRLTVEEVIRCGRVTEELLSEISGAVWIDDTGALQPLFEKADQVRRLNEQITEYLSDLSASGSMSEDQANEAVGIMCLLSDLDRITYLCQEILDSFKDKIEKKYKYSKDAMKDLEKGLGLVMEMYSDSLWMVLDGSDNDKEKREKKLRKKKEKILDLSLSMRKAHMDRISKGKCSAKLTKPFHKILNALDRMSNSCANIAEMGFPNLILLGGIEEQRE